MHPLVRGACLVAVIAVIGGTRSTGTAASATGPAVAGSVAPGSAPPPPTGLAPRQLLSCGPRSVTLEGPNGPLCAPLPDASASLQGGARGGRLRTRSPSAAWLRRDRPHELVPRLPERPASFTAYQLPVDPVFEVGAPLDEPMAPPGERPELGIELVTDPQTPVTLVDLEGQRGQAEVVLVGDLHGVTVVTRHVVARGDREREYLVFYGNLDRPGPSITNGARLGPMAVMGYVANAALDDDAFLYFEVRQRREAADGADEPTHLSDLTRDSVSIAVDPRNVLPLAK